MCHRESAFYNVNGQRLKEKAISVWKKCGVLVSTEVSPPWNKAVHSGVAADSRHRECIFTQTKSLQVKVVLWPKRPRSHTESLRVWKSSAWISLHFEARRAAGLGNLSALCSLCCKAFRGGNNFLWWWKMIWVLPAVRLLLARWATGYNHSHTALVGVLKIRKRQQGYQTGTVYLLLNFCTLFNP